MPLTTAPRIAASVALTSAATLALVSTLLVSVGCGQGRQHKEVVELGSPEAKACLQRCDLPRTQCRQRQKARETECAEIYAVAKADYESCLKGGTAKCRAPYTCLGADLSICDREYDDCFAACGGHGEPRPVASASEGPSGTASAGKGSGSPVASGENPSAGTPGGSRPSKMDPP